MPDHAPVFVAGGRKFELAQWVRLLKSALGKPGMGQRGFFDHLLRRDEIDVQKWEYVRQNPVRAGWVKRVEDGPYQGEIVPLEYR